MLQLCYKTRGMSPVRGKSKIYFSAHPLDHQAYFAEISDALLECANISVWHTGGMVTDSENHWDDLEQMQLFVVPVTQRLLTQPNAAMDAEIPFAIKNHIPVLPLMQEPGLDALYSQRFGNLQFLEMNSHDATAIPFEDKLQYYLSSILVREEMVKKIHDAFDARIFLSYRKKDRKQAQELMRQIHSCDFCDDIAIWYDEFLTPGEDFNDSILESIQKSDAFVMVVTPNLVEENNYIMTNEYPMAVEMGKPVLPVEMVCTDSRLLAEKYSGIPETIQAHDRMALTNALANMVSTLSGRDHRAGMERRYYIGLAYLAGIDVEVDREIGVSMIQSAAESGVMEAMEMLIEMYRFGYGVERDPQKTLFWIREKIARRRASYEAEPNAVRLNLLFNDLCLCGDFHRNYDRYADAMELYRAAEQYLEASVFRDDPVILCDLASVCHRMGDIFGKEGRLAEAKVSVTRGIVIMERLVNEDGSVDAQKNLAASYLALGDILYSEGNLDTAGSCYEECLKFREMYAAQTETMAARRELAVMHNRLGRISMMRGALDAARKHFETSLALAEVLVQEGDMIAAKRDVAISCNRLADLEQAVGNFGAALNYGRRNIQACEDILQMEETVQGRQDLYVSYQRYGDILRDAGRWAEAKAYFEKGHAICEALYRQTNSIYTYADLSASYFRLSLVAPILQRITYYGQAMYIINKLCRDYPNVQIFRDYRQSFRIR